MVSAQNANYCPDLVQATPAAMTNEQSLHTYETLGKFTPRVDYLLRVFDVLTPTPESGDNRLGQYNCNSSTYQDHHAATP